MFLWFKKKKKKLFFEEFLDELQLIGGDILFVYKNIIHWSISKIFISLWSFVIGICVALPFFIIAVIAGFIDPINWLAIIEYALTGTDISLEIIAGMAQSPYWLSFIVLLLLTSILGFFLGSSYSLLLQANLVKKYLKREKLPFKKNLYFSRSHITTMLGLLCWNFVYLLAPSFIAMSAILALYLLHVELGIISYDVFVYATILVTVLFMFIISYIAYKIIFGYTILVYDKASKITSSRSYLLQSITITKKKIFIKFVLLVGLYFIAMYPFQSVDTYLDRQVVMLRDAYIYKSGALGNISAEQREYYEYVTQEYKDASLGEIAKKAQIMYILQLLYFFFSYFAFGGLFIVLIVSFYRRVLVKK